MYPLAEKWLDAFGKWPPVNQLVYSAVVLLAALVLTAIVAYMLYLFVYYATVAVRGWPDDTARPTWKDIVFLNRQMEAYRLWEKQRLAQTRSATSTPRSLPSSKPSTTAPSGGPPPTPSTSTPAS